MYSIFHTQDTAQSALPSEGKTKQEQKQKKKTIKTTSKMTTLLTTLVCKPAQSIPVFGPSSRAALSESGQSAVEPQTLRPPSASTPFPW